MVIVGPSIISTTNMIAKVTTMVEKIDKVVARYHLDIPLRAVFCRISLSTSMISIF